MAYDATRMSLLGAAGGAMVWSYQSTDTKATIVAANYFLPVYTRLDPGDRIHCLGNGVAFDAVVTAVSSSSVTTLSSASYA